MNKPILALGLLVILLVSCTPTEPPYQPTQPNPNVGGGCGVQGLPPAMDESICTQTKEGMHCTAKAGF